MWLKAGNRIVNIINLIIRLGAYIAVAMLIFMMLLTVCDVFLRYALDRPIPGGYELTESMMVTFSFLAIAYCALVRGNVRMDIFVSRLPPTAQNIYDIVGYVVCLAVSIPIAWRNFTEAMEVQSIGLASTVLRIPAYPCYLLIFIGMTLLSLVFLSNLVNSVYGMAKK